MLFSDRFLCGVREFNFKWCVCVSVSYNIEQLYAFTVVRTSFTFCSTLNKAFTVRQQHYVRSFFCCFVLSCLLTLHQYTLYTTDDNFTSALSESYCLFSAFVLSYPLHCIVPISFVMLHFCLAFYDVPHNKNNMDPTLLVCVSFLCL